MPINDDKATSLLIGLSLETKKEHIVRAVLESLAFRYTLLYETVLSETKTPLSSLVKYELSYLFVYLVTYLKGKKVKVWILVIVLLT